MILAAVALQGSSVSTGDMGMFVIGLLISLTVLVGFAMKFKSDIEAAAQKREEALAKWFEKILHDARDAINVPVAQIGGQLLQSETRHQQDMREIKTDLKEIAKTTGLAEVLEERLDGHMQLCAEQNASMARTLQRIEESLPSARDYMTVIRAFAEKLEDKKTA